MSRSHEAGGDHTDRPSSRADGLLSVAVVVCGRLIRSTWDHIKTMQKEMDQEVITKRTEKIDRIRAGQRITEVGR